MTTRWLTSATAAALTAALTITTTPAAADPDDRTTTEEEEEVEYGEEWVWIDAGAGIQYVDMVTFEADESLLTAGLIPTSTSGPTIDAGLGVRLWFITAGPRLRVGMFDTEYDGRSDRFTLWSLDGEVGLRIPLGRLEPHVTLAAGYTGLGGVGDIVQQLEGAYAIRGANIRGGAGLDLFIVPELSVGADISGEALLLSRSRVPLADLAAARSADAISEGEARILEADGTSTGASVTAVGKIGVHF